MSFFTRTTIYSDVRYTHARIGVADVANGEIRRCGQEMSGPLPPLTVRLIDI